MNSGTVADFLAVLLLLGGIVVVASLVSGQGRSSLSLAAPAVSAAIAVGATAASLYFSEVAGFVPCELCWYQRIAMYPLAILTVGAWLRGDESSRVYAVVLAVLGLGIALYHVQLQAFPDQQSFCDAAQPCTESPVKAFGRITIPMMSALSFAGVAVLTGFSSTLYRQEAAS